MQSRRVAVRGIIFKDDELLAVRLNKYVNKSSGPDNDYWCTPGGGVEVGEPLKLALTREMIEETGIQPVIGALLYVQQFQDNGCEHLEFFFHIINVDDYLHVDLEATTHGVQEIEVVSFIDPKTQILKPSFLTETDIAQDIQAGKTAFYSNL